MPGSHPGEGIRPGRAYDGLCVFDMDNTLTRDMLSSTKTCGKPVATKPAWSLPAQGVLPVEQYPGLYAGKAIQKCMASNYAVGVATAAPCTPPPALGDPGGKKAKSSLHTRMMFLHDIGMPSNVVSATGQQGPAYQCIDTNGAGADRKSRMVGNLMNYYGTKQEGTVFFDDQQRFLNEVKSVYPKVSTQLASSKECHGKVCLSACGLRKSEFEHGIGKSMLASHPASTKAFLEKTGFALAGSKGNSTESIGVVKKHRTVIQGTGPNTTHSLHNSHMHTGHHHNHHL